ncbi:MAG: alpha/beta fold hydrolase [Nitrosopumilales archaeon]|nr:MAG: alpha/beta fold hydrolase [Nitrosopumilales archaeon]
MQNNFYETFTDYARLLSSFVKLNLEYNAMYLDSIKNTLEQNKESFDPKAFYELLANNLDNIFDKELRTKRFTSILSEYMNSLVDYRETQKRINIPVRYYDEALYQIKKYLFQLSSAMDLECSATATPSEVVFKKGKIELLHYITDKKNIIPLILVYAPINRFNLMDLKPNRSIVKNLISQGFDVYVIHWGYTGIQDDGLKLDDYENYLDEAVSAICQSHARQKIPIVGYCWGGLLSVVYSALYLEKVESLTLMATPIDFTQENSILSVWSKDLDMDKILDEFGHLDPLMLDTAFVMRNPFRNYEKYANLFNKIHDQKYLNDFVTLEKWLHNIPPIPGAFYRQIIDDCYKNNLLILKKMHVNGKLVNLEKIDFPVLTVYAEKDDLISPISSLAINEHISSKDKKTISIPSGHVGLIIGTSAHEKLWPDIGTWIKSKNIMAPKSDSKPTISTRKEEPVTA